jgi:plastocyanin
MRAPKALVLVLAAFTLLGTACAPAQPAAAAKAGSTPKEIIVTATEMAFSPTSLEVAVGQPVKLTLKNNGVVEHNLKAQIGSDALMVTAQPKQSASTTFTPQTPGTYKFVCTVLGHEAAGMVGTVVVK